MFYSGYDGSNFRMGLATSADGLAWTKEATNPVLALGASGSFDDQWAYWPEVRYINSTFHLWYVGHHGTKEEVGYATSTDGITWTKHASNPVLTVGSAGSWDDYSTAPGPVIHDGTTFHMWYMGHDGDKYRIGYASSTDGVAWSKHAQNPVLDVGTAGEWDAGGLSLPRVVHTGSKYEMWYSADNNIGYAWSDDRISWTKYENNPVLSTVAGTWEADALSGGTVMKEDSTYRMWYYGRSGTGAEMAGQIGYATAPHDPTVAIEESPVGLPSMVHLHDAYPNPFNPVTTLRYDLTQGSHLSLIVYDLSGREVARLVESYMGPGFHQVQWGGRNDSGQLVPSGIYIARLRSATPGKPGLVTTPTAGQQAPEYSKSIKMLLLK
jgi:predicted GH43/DUF377 family glycosyl hydrolase